jgi:integrase/recombinase XerD
MSPRNTALGPELERRSRVAPQHSVQTVFVGDRYLKLTRDQAAYAAWLRGRGFSADSIRLYAQTYSRAERALGQLLEDVEPGDLQIWLANHTPGTRATYAAALNTAFDWLNLQGKREGHPLRLDIRQRMLRPAKQQRQPRALSDDQVTRLLTRHTGHRLAWLKLGLRQGLRVHEMAKVRGEDVDVEIFQVTGKGGKTVDLPTDPEIWQLAQEMPRKGWWFPTHSLTGHINRNTITQRVSLMLDNVGASGSTHRLRHTYATTLLRGGMDVEEVRYLLRHESLQTTQIYVSAEWGRLKRASSILDSAYGQRGGLTVVR